MNRFVFVVLIFVLGGLFAGRVYSQTAEELNQQAVEQIASGKVNEGIEMLKKAIAMDSTFAVSYINLGFIYYSNNLLQQAASLYAKALQLEPENAQAHNNMGATLLAAGDLRRAIYEYKLAIQIRPDYAEAHNNLSFALNQAGAFDLALEEAEEALKLKPQSAGAYNNRGMAQGGKGEFAKAEADFKKALELSPQAVTVINNLGSLYRSQGKYDQSIQAHEKAIAIDTLNVESYNNLGLSVMNKGNTEDALKWFGKALAVAPNYAVAHNNISYAYYTMLNYSMAMQHAKAAERHGLKISEQYLEDLGKALDPEYLRARHILVKTRAEADAIISKLSEGAGFSNLAKEQSLDKNSASRGGDLGYFKKGDMSAEFEQAILNTPVGKLSAVLETKLGFHIFERLK